MKSLLLFVIVLPLFCQSQYPRGIADKTQKETVQLTTVYTDGSFSIGTGFIIKGQYVMTCYHNYKRYSNKIIDSIYVFRKNPTKKDVFHVDTGYVDLTYKYTQDQYNFSKHIYDSSDSKTDVIILRLKNRMIEYQIKPAFKTYASDSLYSFGVRQFRPTFCSGKIMLYRKQASVFWIGVLSCAEHGFSGSPFYDSKGRIAGMMQYGWDSIDRKQLDDYVKAGIINKGIYAEIEEGYKRGDKLGFVISIEYLIKKYMKGFIRTTNQ